MKTREIITGGIYQMIFVKVGYACFARDKLIQITARRNGRVSYNYIGGD